MLAADDALSFAPNADALMLVVEENKTRKEELKRVLAMLSDVNVLGIVPNKCQEYSNAYGYHYGYGESK